MRLRVELSAPEAVVIPWDYGQYLMAAVYFNVGLADRQLQRFVHEHGFSGGGRRFRLFTFSYLFPERRETTPAGPRLCGGARWWFSSPVKEFARAFVDGLQRRGGFAIGRHFLTLQGVAPEPEPELAGKVWLETLSPLVASTGYREAGDLRKRFLQPGDADMPRVLEENLRRKYAALHGDAAPGEKISFDFPGPFHSRLFRVRGTGVRGWEMRFGVEGPPELLAVGYGAGFGEHNAAGFGMVRRCQPPGPWGASSPPTG